MVSTGELVNMLGGFANEVKQLGLDYEAENARYKDKKQKIENDYASDKKKAEQNYQSAVSEIQKKHSEYQKKVDDNLVNIHQLEMTLTNLGYRNRNTNSSAAGNLLNTYEVQDLLTKITETGFLVSLKKALSIDGYKLNSAMAQDIFQKIDGSRLYLNNCLYDSEAKMKAQLNSASQQLSHQNHQLNSRRTNEFNLEDSRHRSQLSSLEKRRIRLESDKRIAAVNAKVKDVYRKCGRDDADWKKYNHPKSVFPEILVGTINLPTEIVNVTSTLRDILSKVDCYHSTENSFCIPYTHPTSSPLLMAAETSSLNVNSEAEMFRGIVSRQFQYMPLRSNRITFIDPVGRGSNLGSFSHILNNENKGVCTKYLDNKSISDRLKVLTELVDKRCETLTREGLKTVYEHNALRGANRISYITVVIHDFPVGFDSESLSYLNIIFEKAKQCGISILISRKKSDKLENRAFDVIKAHMSKMVWLSSNGGSQTLSRKGIDYRFHPVINKIPVSFYDEINKVLTYVKPIDSSYSRIFDLSKVTYNRTAKKGLEIPLALDEKGNLVNLKLDCSDRAWSAFVCGVAGAGKTSMFHTLVMSAAYRYHPDDLEIWIADFKESSFADYPRNWIPHVRFVTVYQSEEVAFSLIDTIWEEYQRRNRLFKSVPLVDDYEKYVAKGFKLPRLLIVIDEFSSVAQAIEYDDERKDNFNTILKKVRHAGIHLIIGDQDPIMFNRIKATNNVPIRIAMKGSISDNEEALRVQIKQESLTQLLKKTVSCPEGIMIYKHEEKPEDPNQYTNDLVYTFCRSVYLPDNVRLQLMAKISSAIGPYQRAHDAFINTSPQKMDKGVIVQYEKEHPNTDRSERYYIGTPYGLGSSFYFTLEKNTSNNILLVGDNESQVLSIYRAVTRCAHRYKRRVTLLVYRRSLLYKQHKDFFEKQKYVRILDSFPQICQCIGQTANTLKKCSKDEDFDVDTLPNQLFIFIGIEGMIEQMEDSLLTQEQAWDTSQPEPASKPDEVLRQTTAFPATSPVAVTQDDLKQRQAQRQAERARRNTIQADQDDPMSSFDELIERKRAQLEKEFRSDSEEIPESFAGDSDNQIKGYRAMDDLKQMLHNGYKINCSSMLIISRASDLKNMKLYVNVADDYSHKIALKMSPDKAEVFMSSTKQMKALNDGNEINSAIYSLNDGCEQRFRPYQL